MSEAALELCGVKRVYPGPDGGVEVLRGADLRLQAGEIVALVGPSGAGKSTLLHLAGLLEAPDAGQVLVQGVATEALNDDKRTALRRQTIGFVYQFHQLMPEFSALENVVLPQMIAGTTRKAAAARAMQLLERVGIAHRADHRPGKLSGGEQQRCAIARALANAPRVLLADEPTGNLDPETAERVFAELTRLAREDGVAALIATHNLELAQRMDRVVRLAGGRLSA